MAFEYSCFISYRRSQHRLVERFVSALAETLSEEVEAYTKLPIFPDTEQAEGNEDIEETRARALCRSLCMVVVFTPIYFSRTNTYCAREFKAMEALEKERLSALPDCK